MNNYRNGYAYSTAFFGRRRPLTVKFDEFFESVDDAKTSDFLWLREAVYEQESRGRFLVQVTFGKTYVGDELGDLVLVLKDGGREALLQDLERTCKRASQSDPYSAAIERLLRREDGR